MNDVMEGRKGMLDVMEGRKGMLDVMEGRKGMLDGHRERAVDNSWLVQL